MEKVGILKDGELTVDSTIIQQSHDETAMKFYNACKDVKGSNDCETAYQLYQCYLNNKSPQA